MKITKVGAELEFFIFGKDGKVLDASKIGVSHDEVPFLAEARSAPFNNPFDAAGSLIGRIEEIKSMAVKARASIIKTEPMPIPWKEWRKSVAFGTKKSREDGMTTIIRDNIGKPVSVFVSAGLHVHFSCINDFSYTDSNGVLRVERTNFMNKGAIRRIVRKMDSLFKDDIHRYDSLQPAGIKTERVEGNFREKSHGFEYRAIAANMDYVRIFEIIEQASNILRKEFE